MQYLYSTSDNFCGGPAPPPPAFEERLAGPLLAPRWRRPCTCAIRNMPRVCLYRTLNGLRRVLAALCSWSRSLRRAAMLARVSEPVASLTESSESGKKEASAFISAIRARRDGCKTRRNGHHAFYSGYPFTPFTVDFGNSHEA